MGCELIGSNSLESDLEIICLGVSILKKLGFVNQVVTLNSSLLLNFIFENLEPIKEDIKLLFHKKDYQSIANFSSDKRLNSKKYSFYGNSCKTLSWLINNSPLIEIIKLFNNGKITEEQYQNILDKR